MVKREKNAEEIGEILEKSGWSGTGTEHVNISAKYIYISFEQKRSVKKNG